MSSHDEQNERTGVNQAAEPSLKIPATDGDVPLPIHTVSEPSLAVANASVVTTDTPGIVARQIEPVAATLDGSPRLAPEIAEDRTISGIDLIDYAAGGLPVDRVYLVRGPSGVGKTIAALQFVARGLDLGEPAVWVTNRAPESLLAQARSIGFQLDEAVKRGQLLILKTSDRYFDLVETPADVSAIIEELSDHAREAGVRRLVIDPLYSLVNTTYSTHFAISLAQSLLNGLEELGVTTFLIGSDDHDPAVASVNRVLEQNCAGVITMEPDAQTAGRIMTVSKLRYASSENLTAHYRILNGRGIINYRGEDEKVDDVTRPWATNDTRPRSVLLVSSNPETFTRVKGALGEWYEVSVEPDLQKGVERVRRETPNLVIVSPPQTGRVLPALIDLATNTSSSVVFLSQNANRVTDRVLYLRAGADDFMTEPFTPSELRARVDALVRRGGRRLVHRDPVLSSIDVDAVRTLGDGSNKAGRSELIRASEGTAKFAGDFRERLERNIDTISKLDVNFALFWLKGKTGDRQLNQQLARLCRQEDVLCRNSNGEFVAILPGADEGGVRGFQTRLREKIERFDQLKHGYSVYAPGESIDDFRARALGN